MVLGKCGCGGYFIQGTHATPPLRETFPVLMGPPGRPVDRLDAADADDLASPPPCQHAAAAAIHPPGAGRWGRSVQICPIRPAVQTAANRQPASSQPPASPAADRKSGTPNRVGWECTGALPPPERQRPCSPTRGEGAAPRPPLVRSLSVV